MIDEMKLVQQLDSLTYNARQVLNALIRSCIHSGSSNGYTIRKGDTTLTLDRGAIYKLYDFYQRWERTGYDSDPDAFVKLLRDCDGMWDKTGGNPVTRAVATHAQMCFLTRTSDNGISTADMEGASQGALEDWALRICSSDNRKGTVCSAPIPLNLRTPLYDENLSTKSFSQYETYLFPMEYQAAAILGSEGDGVTHEAGGDNWSIYATNNITLNARHILLGSNLNTRERLRNYRDGATNTISGGTECYALGADSVAFGASSMAYGAHSGVLGNMSVAYGTDSIATGLRSIAYGADSFAGGTQTTAIGRFSAAFGIGSVAGAEPYPFTLSTAENTYTTIECTAIKDENGICSTVTNTDQSYNATSTLNVSVPDGRAFNISVGDRVVVYAQYRKNTDNRRIYQTDNEGYVYTPMLRTVTGIGGGVAGKPYSVTLDTGIPTRENGVGEIIGGTIAVVTKYLRPVGSDGKPYGELMPVECGKSSVALNSYTVACGESQTVVGVSNHPNYDANFIVGVGDNVFGGRQSNGLVVGSKYGVMSTSSGYVRVSVTDTDSSTGSSVSKTYRYMGIDVADGAAMMVSQRARGSVPGEPVVVESVTQSYYGGARLLTMQELGERRNLYSIAHIGVGAVGPDARTLSDKYDITASVESETGAVVVSSASYVEATRGETFSDYMIGRDGGVLALGAIGGDTMDGIVGLYAQNALDIAASNDSGTAVISIDPCGGFITVGRGHLTMDSGLRTMGALPADSSSRSYRVQEFGMRGSDAGASVTVYPKYSGFYYTEGMSHAFGGAVHCIDSVIADGNDYKAAGIILPDALNNKRPVVWSTDGGAHELAYRSELDIVNSNVTNEITSLTDWTKPVLAGFTEWNGESTPAQDTQLQIYSSGVSHPSSINNIKMPVVSTVYGETTRTISPAVVYCDYDDTLNRYKNSGYQMTGTDENTVEIMSNLRVSMIGSMMSFIAKCTIPAGYKSVVMPIMLGGFDYVTDTSLRDNAEVDNMLSGMVFGSGAMYDTKVYGYIQNFNKLHYAGTSMDFDLYIPSAGHSRMPYPGLLVLRLTRTDDIHAVYDAVTEWLRLTDIVTVTKRIPYEKNRVIDSTVAAHAGDPDKSNADTQIAAMLYDGLTYKTLTDLLNDDSMYRENDIV